VGGKVEELWRKGFVGKMIFEPGVLTDIEYCQRRFTKKIRGLANMTHHFRNDYAISV